MKKKKEILRADEYGRKGGNATKKKYGNKHFSELVKKRWEKAKANKEA